MDNHVLTRVPTGKGYPMTRKDFELISDVLKAERNRLKYNARLFGVEVSTMDILAHDFAERLKSTSAQFNRDKFLRACGVTP